MPTRIRENAEPQPAGAGLILVKGINDDELRALRGVLRSHARRAVACPDLADDLVQETILAAISARSFEGRSSPRSWLLGILSHKVVDHYRSASSRRPPVQEPPDLTARGPSPETALARHEAVDKLEQLLPTLPELERLAILLVDVEGMDRSQACNAMDVRPTHLRVLLHRGRHRLRKALILAGMPSPA